MKKAVVAFSGGESSARVAIMAADRFGPENTILLNHNISSKVEHADIKRFKQEVADHLGISITYANHPNYEDMAPLDVCRSIGTFNGGRPGQHICTYNLKTVPCNNWLQENFPASFEMPNENMVLLLGFDANETGRIQRRSSAMGVMGYKTDYPLAFWDNPIERIEDIGIQRPITYKIYKHANCIGCLKAGKQHWYCVYCMRPDIWKEAVATEAELGLSMHSEGFLTEWETEFYTVKHEKGICPSEKMDARTFWAKVKKTMPGEDSILPCECAI